MYKLTAASLYAAVTTGNTTEGIITQLQCLCKNILKPETMEFVERHTRNVGKLELVEADLGTSIAVYYDMIARKMTERELGSRFQLLGLAVAVGGEHGLLARDVHWQIEFDEDRMMASGQSATFFF